MIKLVVCTKFRCGSKLIKSNFKERIDGVLGEVLDLTLHSGSESSGSEINFEMRA
jgi:hypothetical protein